MEILFIYYCQGSKNWYVNYSVSYTNYKSLVTDFHFFDFSSARSVSYTLFYYARLLNTTQTSYTSRFNIIIISITFPLQVPFWTSTALYSVQSSTVGQTISLTLTWTLSRNCYLSKHKDRSLRGFAVSRLCEISDHGLSIKSHVCERLSRWWGYLSSMREGFY